MYRRLFLATVLVPIASTAQQPAVVFAGGRAEVRLPNGMVVVSNERKTLVATFGPAGDYKLEMTLHEDFRSAGIANLAEGYVADRAKQKGAHLYGSKGLAVFLDPGGNLNQDEESYRTMHFQAGFAESMVVGTITSPYPATATLKEFLGSPFNSMLTSLHQQ